MEYKIFLIFFVLFFVYITSILLLLFLLKRTLILKSLGYIVSAKLFKLRFFPLSFSVKIKLAGTSIDKIRINNVRIKFLSLRNLKFVFPKILFVYHNDFIRKIRFNICPEFSVNIAKSRDLKLEHPIKVEIIGKDENSFDAHISVDKFIIKNIIGDELKTSIDTKYHFDHNSMVHHKTNINVEILFGISERTKSRYLKAINFKNFEASLKNSYISGRGRISYKAMSNPEGVLNFHIKKIESLASDIFIKKEETEFFRRFRNFCQYIQETSRSDIEDYIVEFLFEESGVKINNVDLSKIQKLLNS